MKRSLITHSNVPDRQLWNRVVCESKEGTFFHSFEWSKIIEEYGKKTGSFKPRHIFVEDEETNALVGILPLFLDERRRLVSLPYGDYGGPCISTVEKEDVLEEMFRECEQNAKRDAFEVRLKSLPKNYLNWLFTRYGYDKNPFNYTFLLPLEKVTMQEVWKNFRRDTKRGINKAQKSGVIVEQVKKKEAMRVYYPIYVETMKRLKATIRRFDFFEILWDTLSANRFLNVHLAKYQNKYIAGLLSISWKGRMHIYGNVSFQETHNLKPNDLLYYSLINCAVEKGEQIVDFGLTPLDPNSGLYQFKYRWGGAQKVLYLSSKKYRKIAGQISSKLRKMPAFIHWKKRALKQEKVIDAEPDQ